LQALFGKRPTEKDPAKGTSPAVDFTRREAARKRPAPRMRDLAVQPTLLLTPHDPSPGEPKALRYQSRAMCADPSTGPPRDVGPCHCPCGAATEVTGIDTVGALHSRGGSAILPELGDTAWWHVAPVIVWDLTRPEPGKRRGQGEAGPCVLAVIAVWPGRGRRWLPVRCRVLRAAGAGRDPWALPG